MNKTKELTFFIVKNRALGDSLLGLGAVRYLRSLYPKSTIIYAIPQWTTALYREVETDADYIYPLKLNSLSDIIQLYTDLIDFKVDAIHEMHQTGRGHKIFTLAHLLLNIPYTFHNHHLKGSTPVIDQGEKKELIQRDLDGLYSFYGNKSGRIEIPHFLNFCPVLKLREKTKSNFAKKRRIIFGVVATRKTKMWPLENFIELASELIQTSETAHNELEILIPLSSSQDDEEIKKELNDLIEHRLQKKFQEKIKIVQLPLNVLPEVFSESFLYIGNDTGLKHLAIACGLPTFTMFGPEPIREWHPYDRNVHKAFYIENLTCRTRIQHFCGLSECDMPFNSGHMKCMKDISVAEVLSAVKDYI